MPITPTYPGVYIEEIPSGVRTITGVATSITAFIGRAWRGPVNDPITINSYADYERLFGGLWVESSMSYAVRDFYLNGGTQAIIVRLYHEEAGAPTHASINANGLILEAAYPGSWGNFLRARIDHDVSPAVAERYDLEVDQLFNLTVRDTKTGATEEFRNVSIVPSPRQVSNVLANESRLVRVDSLPGAIPTPHPDPLSGEDLWGDNPIPTNSPVEEPDRASDGEPLAELDFTGPGMQDNKEGLYALKKVDLLNLLCIPPHIIDGDIETGLITSAASYCEERRAMLLIDPPSSWNDKEDAKTGITAGVGTTSKNAAIFFPRLNQANLLRDNQIETFVPCGAVAGIFARTDAQRGVWKAPAGLEATLNGVPALSVTLTDAENGELNPLGVNCLRSFPGVGRVVWGSRTLQGADRLASEWKYIPVRRLTLFLEESLYRGTQWVVFEPNDEPLWAQIRLNIGAFMNNLFRQGAFQGKSPREAYFVKCDKETTTQNDIDRGIVNIIVGFAPLKPAEFVII
ncbi:MAG TPA: phage tail protein, partial [Cyanobacteria bacterium UBA8803]|nr:phage tail protein [Cyanobacteria bacterium UBA8803]